MNFNLKKILKQIKLNENNISMVLGAVVIVIVGVLVVNYFKDRQGTTIPAISTNENAKEHVVTGGETLWSISEDVYGSGYNWVDISKENELTSDKIEVGQKLKLPEVSTKEPTVTSKIESVVADEVISGDTYTVVKGDTLWDISVRAYGDGYKWVEVAEANNLDNPNVIHAGNVLVLPK